MFFCRFFLHIPKKLRNFAGGKRKTNKDMSNMKKLSILLAGLAALVACDRIEGEMTLPNDNTLPAASVYVQNKPLDEADAYLRKLGYVYVSAEEDGAPCYERGEKSDSLPGKTEEQIWLEVFYGTVCGLYGMRAFHNLQDAISVYRKWSNYTWRHVFPNPDDWGGSIEYAESDEKGRIISDHEQYFWDGTYSREEVGVEDEPNRKDFEKALAGLRNADYVNESYEYENKPNRLEMYLTNLHGEIYIKYDNHNYDMITPPVAASVGDRIRKTIQQKSRKQQEQPTI